MTYEKPEMNVLLFEEDDVVTLSNAGTGPGESTDLGGDPMSGSVGL